MEKPEPSTPVVVDQQPKSPKLEVPKEKTPTLISKVPKIPAT
jgi:hypothetical protein